MTTKLLCNLKEYEEELDFLYEEDEELTQKIETAMTELKMIMKQKILVEAKIEDTDVELEKIKNKLVNNIVTPYNIGVHSLNTIEQDRLILMLKSNNNSKIEEALIGKLKGLDFGSLKTVNKKITQS